MNQDETDKREGDRVRLREDYETSDGVIPAGSLGTVVLGFAAALCVEFDDYGHDSFGTLSYMSTNDHQTHKTIWVVNLCDCVVH